MKSEDYEYQVLEDNYEIPENRKGELIEKVKNQVSKGFIAHFQILKIGKNDEELDFLYQWLDDNNIKIRGINGTIAGEIPNYIHIKKMGQDFTPETLDDEEQEKLFLELSKFSKEDKKDGLPAYLAVRGKIIEHNMKLAKWITNWKSISKIPIPLEDKQQMAYVGLINAVDRFNPTRGVKFSSYACKYIYGRIIREVYREDSELKQSFDANEQVAMIPNIEEEIFSRFGRKAKPYEIADILGVSLKRVSELQTLINLKEKESLEQFNDNRRKTEEIIGSDSDLITQTSDEAYVKDGVYIDEKDVLPEGFREKDLVRDKVMVRMLSQDLKKSLLKLKEREKDVLLIRFGFDDGEMKTLNEVSKKLKLGVTKETVRQIEAKAIRKLRKPLISRYVEDYLDEDGYVINERI